MLTVGDTFPEFALKAVKAGADGLDLEDRLHRHHRGIRRRQVEGGVLLAEGFHLRLPDRDRRLRQAGR